MNNAEANEVLREMFCSGAPFLATMQPWSADVEYHQDGTYEIEPWRGVAECTEVPSLTWPEADYETAVAKIISALRCRGGKTVIARTIAGAFGSFNSAEMVARYFSLIPNALRFVFGTGDGSWWMGATPELLLKEDGRHQLMTRALAGTRKSGTSEWTAKNMAEHAMVVDDMQHNLNSIGITYAAQSIQTLRYADIEHLCTDIALSWDGSIDEYRTIASAIHPTAAVGGSPRQQALEQIENTEPVSRGFYGGTMTFRSDGKLMTYVVLRAAHFDRQRWCLYTGSGITADSDPHDEWLETRAKAAPLLSILQTSR